MGSGDDSAATAAVTVGGELRAIMSLSCVIFISLSSYAIMKVTDCVMCVCVCVCVCVCIPASGGGDDPRRWRSTVLRANYRG
jgi:hypothetical protein